MTTEAAVPAPAAPAVPLPKNARKYAHRLGCLQQIGKIVMGASVAVAEAPIAVELGKFINAETAKAEAKLARVVEKSARVAAK